jgi:hypothetical protein
MERKMNSIMIDFGRARQAKERAARRRKPAAMKLLMATGDTLSSSEKLRELQDRATHMALAEQQWRALPVWKRIFFVMIGETPVSHYEGQA